MGFYYIGNKAASNNLYGVSLDFLHRSGCAVCPLGKITGNKHPNMKATGAKKPLDYKLGEAPGKQEDIKGRQFVGPTGEVLRFRIPDDWLDDLRWNNTVRTRPPKNRDPTPMEMECCRPSIVKDIEESQPVAIFGFGNIPLSWAIKRSGITLWTGRRFPLKVGKHTCWYYPLVHPSYVSRSRKFEPRDATEYGSDEEFAFALHLEKAFREVEEGLPEPIVHSQEDALRGIDFVTGQGGKQDVDRVLKFLRDSWSDNAVGVDLETPQLRPYSNDAEILTVAIARRDETLAFPLHHPGALWSPSEFDAINVAFSSWLHDAKCRKVSFGLPFEMEWSAYIYGGDCLRSGKWEDAQLQAFTLDERPGCLSLEFLCLQEFGIDVKAISNVDRKNLAKTPVETVLRYNGVDAKYHRHLFFSLGRRLEAEGLQHSYEVLLRRAPTVTLTQLQGVPADQKVAKRLDRKYEGKVAKIEDELDALKVIKAFKREQGYDYRPSSPKDVRIVFQDMLKIEGMENVQEATIEKVDHPVAQLTIQWRKAAKARSTYITPCIRGVEGSQVHDDGLLHPVLSLHKTRTTRTSSEEPNSQNYPQRNEETREVRASVNPGEPYRVVSIDYSGIQARNIAMESLDQALIKAFKDRYDIHKDWMENILRVYPQWGPGAKIARDKVLFKEYRYKSKNGFVFPSFFGAQPKSIGAALGIPENKVAKLQDMLWGRFSQVHGWQERLHKSYYEQGYVTCHAGFRRRAPVSTNQRIIFCAQADEARIVLDAMDRLSESNEPLLQPVMEIHDDLVFIWNKRDVDALAEEAIDIMLDVPFKWAHVVPIEVEMKIGKDWAEMDEVGTYSSDTWGSGKFTRKDYP